MAFTARQVIALIYLCCSGITLAPVQRCKSPRSAPKIASDATTIDAIGTRRLALAMSSAIRRSIFEPPRERDLDPRHPANDYPIRIHGDRASTSAP